MDASVMGNATSTLTHLMLHRNINLGTNRAARTRKAGPEPGLLTVRPSSATLSGLDLESGRTFASRLWGEDIVIGVDSIIIMLIVGAIAGWLAGQIVRGFGFGLLWNIVIGIIGAFVGVWLLKQLGFNPFAGFVGSIVNATIGAVILLIIVGFIRR
jgi:uncharacterized membrane protein YeaQ/YmgE (transglycosylase-associated protein family)